MRLLKFLIDFIVFILLVLNLKYLTTNYLMYECDNNCAEYFPVILDTPKLSVCFDLLEVAKPGDSQINWLNFNLSTTLNDLLHRMPDPAHLIESCMFRNSTLDLMIHIKSSVQCAHSMAVTRYRMQGYLCYRFEVYEPFNYSYHSIVNSLYQPRELFAVTLKGEITSLKTFFPLLHLSNYPDIERIFERPMYKQENAMYQLVYGIYEAHGLPAPYESRCIDWTSLRCFQQCMSIFLEPFNFVPDSNLVVEYSHDSYRGLMPRNNPLAGEFEKMRSTCYKRCEFDSCLQEIVATRVSPPYQSDGKLQLIVESTARPVAKIEQIPKLLFADYATQACSVISIWIGINFTSIAEIFKKKSDHALVMKTKMNMFAQSVRQVLGAEWFTELSQECQKPECKKRKSNKNLRVAYIVLDCIISIVVLSLFTLQMVNVLSNYFKYDTTIRFHLETNLRVQVPLMSICLGYSDAFNFTVEPEVTEDNYKEYFTRIDLRINETLQYLFDQLRPDDLIAGCRVRNWTDRMKPFIYYDGDACLKHFQVSTYFIDQMFCYRIEPDVLSPPAHQSDLTSLLIKPSVIFTLDLRSNFAFNFARIYLYSKRRFPGWDNEPLTIADSGRKREIVMSTRLFVNNLLEPPYDTQCSDGSRTRCYFECLRNYTIGPYLAYVVGIDKKVDHSRLEDKIMSYTELADETFYTKWRQIESICENKCDREKCQYNFTTAMPTGEWPVIDDKLKISVQTPSSPTNIMITMPVMVIYDLMYQVMCCLSFWLGFSIVAVNPLTRLFAWKLNNIGRSSVKRFSTLNRMVRRLVPKRFLRKYNRDTKVLSRPSCAGVISWLTHLVAAVCCLAHLFYSMRIYLRHATFIDVSQDVEWTTNYSLYVCIDRAEMMARDQGMDMYNLTVDERTEFLKRPVKEIFDNSPPEDSIIQGCSHRGLSSRRGDVGKMEKITDRILFVSKGSADCYDHYSVKKSIVGSLLCYSLAPKNFTGWTRIELRGVLNDATTLYTIAINASLLTARFSLLTGVYSFFPTTSSEFAPNLYKDPRYNYYIVSYIKYVSSFLPTPYPNEDFVPFMFDRCVSSCISAALDGTGKTLSSRFTDSSAHSNVTFFTLADRRVTGTAERIKQLTSQCERRCTYYNDHIVKENLEDFPITVTAVATATLKSLLDLGLVLLDARTTSIPVFSIYFRIRISLFEQIINLGSIVSIWFGFSAISLASVRKVRKRKITPQHLTEMDDHLALIRKIYEFA